MNEGRKESAHLLRDAVVDPETEDLGDHVAYADVQQHVRVLEWDLSGHCSPANHPIPSRPIPHTYKESDEHGITRTNNGREGKRGKGEWTDGHCMTPSEIARFCIGAFILPRLDYPKPLDDKQKPNKAKEEMEERDVQDRRERVRGNVLFADVFRRFPLALSGVTRGDDGVLDGEG